MKGTNFGVWEKEYNKAMTGYQNFNYPEFKGYHADLYWVDIQTKNSPDFRVYAKSNDVFLRMLTPEQAEDGRHTIVDFPTGDISFLHGIDPIGTKFNKAEWMGPQSSSYRYRPNNMASTKITKKIIKPTLAPLLFFIELVRFLYTFSFTS